MARKVPEHEVEEAVDAVMEELDSHELAGTDVTPSSSISFWEAIRDRALERAAVLRTGHGVSEGDDGDEDDVDEGG